MSHMPSPAFVELPTITTSLLEDTERLQESEEHAAAGEQRDFSMPVSIDSGSSRGEAVREASGRFVCGRLSYGGGLAMGGFYGGFSVRPHLDTCTSTHIIKYQIGWQFLEQFIFPLSCLSLTCLNIKGCVCGHYHSHYSY